MKDWQNLDPSLWPKTAAFYPQICSSCGLDVEGATITNIRGVWEHYTCVLTAYTRFQESRRVIGEKPWTIGTQREMIEAIKELRHAEIWHDPKQPDTGRYAWRGMDAKQ